MMSNVIQFLSSAAMMMSSVYIPNFAVDLGATRTEVGLMGASFGFAIFLSSYIFGRASDMRDRRTFLTVGLLLSTITFLLQVIAKDALSLIVIRALMGFSIGIFIAPLIAYTSESGVKPGMLVSYGSLGWAVGGLLAGLIAKHGESYTHINSLMPYWEVFILSSLFLLASFIISLKLPEVKMKPMEISLFPIGLIKKNIHVYLSSLLRNAGAFSIWIIFPLFLVDLGASKFWIGVMYFINAGTQVMVMRRLDLLSDTKLINLGLVLSSITFFLYTLAKNFYHVIPVQVLLAASYSCLYVGSLMFLTSRNEEKATCIGILNSTTSIANIIGPILGGVISQAYGYSAVMYFAVGISLAGLLTNLIRFR